MSKHEYVEFTGILPKELIGAKKPIYGRVVKRSKSKKFVTVKPKNRTYEVTVDEADVTIVPKSKFTKKHTGKRKKPNAKKKVAAKKTGNITVVGDGPVKVVPKPKPEPKPKVVVVKNIPENNKSESCPTKEEMKETSIPKPVTEKYEKAVDPIQKEPEQKIPYLEEEHDEGGGVIIWVAIGLIIAAAVGAWYLFF